MCLLGICISSFICNLLDVLFEQICISVSLYHLLLLHLWCYHYTVDASYLILKHGIMSTWSVFQISSILIHSVDCCLTVLLKLLLLSCQSWSRTYSSVQLFIYWLNSSAVFRRKLIPFLDISLWILLNNLSYWYIEPIHS